MQCRATKDGAGNYVLNGTKQWITNATLASFYVIFATEDPALKHKGIGAFIVERSQDGIKPGRHEDKLGQRASDTASVILEDVRVPASQVARRARPGLQARDGDASTRRGPTSARARWASCAGASTSASPTRASARRSACRSRSTSSSRR